MDKQFFHDPSQLLSWQISNPHLLAIKSGIDVVHDFRRRDIILSGQRFAPLVPIFHKLITYSLPKSIAVNIGGVANITYIDKEQVITFDIGPRQRSN